MYHPRVEGDVCLGCGEPVSAEGACACAPRSRLPMTHPYRTIPLDAPCPRCGGRLDDRTYHDATCPTCANCSGMFIARPIVERLSREDGAPLRLSFPRLGLAPAHPVKYLPCVVCTKLMNRTVFGRMSGVIVDVCKDCGVWFDAGEIGKVIAFIESGGIAKAEQRARQGELEQLAYERSLRRMEENAQAVRGSRRAFDTESNRHGIVMADLLAALFR